MAPPPRPLTIPDRWKLIPILFHEQEFAHRIIKSQNFQKAMQLKISVCGWGIQH